MNTIKRLDKNTKKSIGDISLNQIIECIKDYPMLEIIIPKGTILKEDSTQSKIKSGETIFTDKCGNTYHFDNSEVLFSPKFQTSFKLINKD
jgi:radical SAM superfamily enzyme with C-terminal helix-hairpin-helix motif